MAYKDITPKTKKYWDGVRQGQSCLMERNCFFSSTWPMLFCNFFLELSNICFLVAFSWSMVSHLNLEVGTRELVNRQLKILENYYAMFHMETCYFCWCEYSWGSWGVICNNNWVLGESHKNTSKITFSFTEKLFLGKK